MAQLCKVVKGEKGYVWVKTDSHGGADAVKVYNDDPVLWLKEIPEEYGYVQLKKDPEWPLQKEYWIEKSHLLVVEPTPPPAVSTIVGKYIVTIEKLE